MMNRVLSFSFLLPVLFFFSLALPLLPTSYSNTLYQPYQDCAPVPFSCGSLKINITYPFLLNTRPSYCGHPDFILTCDNNSVPVIHINDNQYLVKEVQYSTQYLTIVERSTIDASCPLSYHNFTLDPSLFAYTILDCNVSIFINCTSFIASTSRAIGTIGCYYDIIGLFSYYLLDESDVPWELESCKATAILPINQADVPLIEDARMGFIDALKDGFTLKWLPGDGWCASCEKSGGYCGFSSDSSSAGNTCFCSYGSSDGSCSSSDKARVGSRNALLS